MTKELLFWICMLLSALGSGGMIYRRHSGAPAASWELGVPLLLFVAICVLGWAFFGSPVKG